MSTQSSFFMKRWFPWVVAAIVVGVLAIIFGYQGYLGSLHEDKDPVTLGQSIQWQLGWWYLWLLLSPIILILSRKFPMTRPGGTRNLLVHVPAAIFLTSFHTTVFTFLNWLTNAAARKEEFWPMVLKNGLGEQLQFSLFFYAIIVGIASALNYYRIYQEEELKASQLETELSQTRFHAMKMQVYPHFLFNTLREITGLMKVNVDEADRMIARLGDFLRLSMENVGTQVVALQRELNFLRCYLEIEKIRTHDKLSFDMDVDQESMSAPVPNLLLQPLIESSVQQMNDRPAHVQIFARRENGNLRVQITDTCGQSAETGSLTEMRTRLHELYGDNFYLDAARSPDGRNAVTLEIPV
jgi:hypothetical protein